MNLERYFDIIIIESGQEEDTDRQTEEERERLILVVDALKDQNKELFKRSASQKLIINHVQLKVCTQLASKTLRKYTLMRDNSSS